MQRPRWLVSTLAFALAHCGSSATPVPTDASVEVETTDVLSTDLSAEPDALHDVSVDTASPVDAAPSPDLPDVPDVAEPGEASASDAPPVDTGDLDAALIDHVEGLDITLVEDITLPDAPTEGRDSAALADAPNRCATGLHDECPGAGGGSCPPLAIAHPTSVRFDGLRASVLLSCEGSVTRNSRDGVIPLHLSSPSDLVLTAQPTGNDLVVMALYRADGCGVASGEVRCVNPGRLGETARLTVASLEPGTYYVAISSVLGNPVTLNANASPARPRRRGDVCPGAPVIVDGPPTVVDSGAFLTTADYGTHCGAGSSNASWVDGVFSYTLTSRRDVTITVDTVEGGTVAVEVQRSCGQRASSLPPCLSGGSVRQVIRAQEPGTWYVSVDRRANSRGTSLRARVATAEPSVITPADRCPGEALSEGQTAVTSLDGLQGDLATSCLRSPRADAFYSFIAPAAGSDVLVNAWGVGEPIALALQTICGMNSGNDCVSTAERETPNLWRRLQGLTPGSTYTLAVATAQSRDALRVRYLTTPTAVRIAVSGNTSCARAATLPPTGGLFTGSTSGGERSLSTACGGLACIGGRRVFYRLQLGERRRVVVNTLGSSFDTVLSMYSDECPGRAIEGACSDNAMGTAAMLDTTLDAGRYLIALGGCGVSAQGNYALDVSLHAP